MARRLFIAVDLPESVRRSLTRLVQDAPHDVRTVPHGQLHLTLHFLGEVDDATCAAVVGMLPSAARPALAIDLAGAGVFPPRGRPSVLWAGVEASDELRALHEAVAGALETCGLTPEKRPWIPHVTLARLTPHASRDWIAAVVARARFLDERDVPVTAIRLYESTRTPEGVRHVPLVGAPLHSRRVDAD